MKFAVIGTGAVGQALAGKLDELGHEVTVGTRDVNATLTRVGELASWATFKPWLRAHPSIKLVSFPEAAGRGEIIVNATKGSASVDVLAQAGAENLNHKVIIDVSNPVDHSRGTPPTLEVANTDSLGEQLQRSFPRSQVVKTLNIVDPEIMIRPAKLARANHSMFVSGNDRDAKNLVMELLGDFGWRDVVDLGDISSARATEMLVPLWYRVHDTLGTTTFSFKLVR